MKLLKWLFGSTKPTLEDKYDGFDIEHLPAAGQYFPRYKGKYLYLSPIFEQYSLKSDKKGCEKSSSKDGAIYIIDKYLESQGIGIQIISAD